MSTEQTAEDPYAPIADCIGQTLDAYGGHTADGELRNRCGWREASAASLVEAIMRDLRPRLRELREPSQTALFSLEPAARLVGLGGDSDEH